MDYLKVNLISAPNSILLKLYPWVKIRVKATHVLVTIKVWARLQRMNICHCNVCKCELS